MTLIITVVHVLVSLALVFIVLLQKGSGADMGAAFGGSSQSVFGARGSGSFLGKVTAALATVFMITSLTLAFVSTQRGSHASVMEANPPISKPAPETSDPTSPMPAKESSKSSEPYAQPATVPTPPSEK
jgi:preprotein translocase subunit SecG